MMIVVFEVSASYRTRLALKRHRINLTKETIMEYMYIYLFLNELYI